jgi:DNA-binding response OmpR family regulator
MSKILVIDDDKLIRSMVSQTLIAQGHEVIEAGDGNEGIDIYCRSQPDLVITDIIMPEKEGLETIKEIRDRSPQARILAISGGGRLGTMDFLQIARKLGADRILHKPFDPDELLDMVEDTLRG